MKCPFKSLLTNEGKKLTCLLWCQKMKIFHIFFKGFHVLMNCVRSNTPNLNKSVVLNEDGVARQVSVNYRILEIVLVMRKVV